MGAGQGAAAEQGPGGWSYTVSGDELRARHADDNAPFVFLLRPPASVQAEAAAAAESACSAAAAPEVAGCIGDFMAGYAWRRAATEDQPDLGEAAGAFCEWRAWRAGEDPRGARNSGNCPQCAIPRNQCRHSVANCCVRSFLAGASAL
eukprot:TRINITY_DN32941_c0_g1_i1.p1 TRINITY_DN32941_c0_g1~~TRINITY_DN32941_c0_g1_i1.p1  ORF type:complete len:173 (+),score=34.93 TRINITY_DN32941_c0_g1_i1:76-519(+)